ncbi:MAG: 4-hydroxythreonine-4-phosphate dehydrogenase PdxA [Alistipes sp.]|nr:4-hydroxythreonine-4-phosphate dehydrogenase PdxA [Alistipes sp.]MBQ2416028.1 4-hydroxythreonine-4-phosphate dehydrogenase PdxA [Alistipes sp.]MBQ5786388.1 4-hydroxythreonine-4-phosphate dehydrogenase PdxA [Alistipes sp.]
MSDNRLKIGITQGDANGVGWEIILRTLADQRMTELFTPVVYGSKQAADFYSKLLNEEEGSVQFNVVSSAEESRRGKVNLVECGQINPQPGVASAEAGKAAVEALERAMADLKAGDIDAMVTAPIMKETAQSETFQFTGHTEFVASHLEGEPMMIMCSDRLRVGLVTIHIPVSEVSQSISKEKILSSLTTLRQSLKADFGIVEPRIAVLSLNPHAGEGGMLGSEEQEIIKPAIEEAFQEGTLAFGPFPADGLFATGAYAKYDAILAMYHDQGLTPFKTLSPDGVNFTAGLSEVRTSPDHGTAYDIAGKGEADPQSMRNAIYAAIDIVRNRRNWAYWNRNPLQRFEREKGRDVSVKDLKLPEIEE